MKWKIVTDSGSDIRQITPKTDTIAFQYVPLVITIDNQEYIDDENLDLETMLHAMEVSKNATTTACPSPDSYASSFRDAENVICFTLSKEISGSYNSACLAKDLVLKENPNAKIHIFNTHTAGTEMNILVHKAVELAEKGYEFEELVDRMNTYHEHTGVHYLLESIDNLVKNGRVNRFTGTMIGLLGIRLIGQRTPQGTMELAHKVKGEKKALRLLLEAVEENGYQGGTIEISHALNEESAKKFSELLLEKYPNCQPHILSMSGLCSYYAEKQGLIIGYDTLPAK
ncbi:DegV family protein [Vaginisenegalia massiliensis]|uniref:DegV family protein n=1 Tax=Vaginisenegalia massiliensis TaxID=2058294 RepID=UPI000F520C75|nr:DegV family protein [Vaginisenegalia massiliensis]